MKVTSMLARVPARFAFWALAGVALLLSHDAVFLVQVGPGESLTRTLREAGHDYLGWASLALAIIGLAAGLAAVRRLHLLRRQARALDATPMSAGIGSFPAIWPRLFAAVAIGFVLQENVEHVIIHGHAPGLGALLGPEYPLALPVLAAITALAALVAAALRGAEDELVAVISAALRRALARAPRDVGRAPLRLALPQRSPLALALASRAPPRGFNSVL